MLSVLWGYIKAPKNISNNGIRVNVRNNENIGVITGAFSVMKFASGIFPSASVHKNIGIIGGVANSNPTPMNASARYFFGLCGIKLNTIFSSP